MAKRNPPVPTGPSLYESHKRAVARDEQVRERRIRRQHALFIPKLVREAARSNLLAGADQDRAYAIALRWADLDLSGQILGEKETAIDTQFLDQVFGEGLGYRVKTTSPNAWHLEHKFSVPGVGTADAALGDFPAADTPTAVIELKDARTDLDRDRSNGRTAVQQCWDYLNALPGCTWGIVSNFRTIRLYHRAKGTLTYEEFTLQEMRDRARFREFYCLFGRGGLLRSARGQTPRAAALFLKTLERQKEVGDELYREYQWRRLELIEHLHGRGQSLDEAIRVAQKLLDRVIFIAFCEDRGLLPENVLETTRTDVRPYSRAKNPGWENFLDLFRAVDQGARGKWEISAYNGGLFAPDPAIDDLELDDKKWTNAFAGFGEYDFSEEVTVEVLGRLFERSITELEKLRVGGLFALKANIERENGHGHASRAKATGETKSAGGMGDGDAASSPGMPKSPQRKRFGIYYTPPAFTALIVERTLDAIVAERFSALKESHEVDPDDKREQDPRRLLAYWSACLETLKTITVCDPACGSGAFLIRAYDALDAHYKAVAHGLAGAGMPEAEIGALTESIPDLILKHNLYGVDLSLEAVEITQLALWIRSARVGKTLADLSTHVVRGNSLVADPAVDPHALDWRKAFPTVFGENGAGGFTCVVGNPPWERIKVQDREFFSLTDPDTAEAVNAAERKQRIAAMPETNGDLHTSYLAARETAQEMLDYARGSGRYPLTGKGDVNLYMLFAELARSLVAPDGIAGVLVPSGIATDDTTKEFFNDLMDTRRLVSLYDFENKEGHFEDVHRSFKFTALVFGGETRKTEQADFVFFARGVEETESRHRQRHIPLTAADMALFNPNTKTCPIFRTRRDAELTRAIYRRVPILIDEHRKRGGNPWGIQFLRMFDQTNDAACFLDGDAWGKAGYKRRGNVYVKGRKKALPLYEAKMVQAFDHRAASVVVEEENWMRQGQKDQTSLVQHKNPEFSVLPRWWVDATKVSDAYGGGAREWLLVFKDVTSATNERTMIASFLPWVAVVNSAPILLPAEGTHPRLECCLLANMNSLVYDFVARQKVGSVHLNFFIVQQLPTLSPDAYAEKCPWSKRETLEHWISERVLKLTCAADDMIPLANACGFTGSRGDGVHLWKEAERAAIRAELDAAYFILYGIERPDVEHVLSTFSGVGFKPPDERAGKGAAWSRGGIGELTLEAFDRLTNGA
ncbi:MAG: N-6 DNA methylase [Planctomycetes bacterium]|nr:N-6 DNA methylase [Planctomycetota bacterium]